MTYLQFHFVFTLPAIVVLAIVYNFRRDLWHKPYRIPYLAVLSVIAFVYTIAWDNYLVYKGIWWYGEDRVLGTIGYVPIEEYMFFILQPILTGLWLYFILSMNKEQSVGSNKQLHQRIGGILFIATLFGGWLLMQFDAGLYMGLIIIWAGPVIGGQWWYAGSWFWARRSQWLLGIGIPTLYLWVADRIAIGLGIWSISEQYTLGPQILGLPLEEATFFLVTNVLVVQGLMMFLHIGDPARKNSQKAVANLTSLT